MSAIDISPKLRDAISALAKQAGTAIMDVYEGDDRKDFGATTKIDNSPLTIADLRSHEIIAAALHALTPQWPVLSEESADIPFEERSRWQTYWLVDPLDGTKEFVSRNGEFTVNIALIHDHVPVLGVVGVPALGKVYTGVQGVGASREDRSGAISAIKVRPIGSPKKIMGSRSHGGGLLDRYLGNVNDYELVSMGSALKFCVVAEGEADVYPRLGPTSEWDTAAAQAVVEAAGGVVCEFNGDRLRYNTKSSVLNPNFIVIGDRTYDWLQPAKGLF